MIIMNDTKFIYVFNSSDKNKLLSLGYTLIKSDEKQSIYVFDNLGKVNFSTSDMDFVLTNTLTF